MAQFKFPNAIALVVREMSRGSEGNPNRIQGDYEREQFSCG